MFTQREAMPFASSLLGMQHLTKGKPMSQATSNQHDPDMLDEYDFSKGVRGKYADRYHAGTNLVRLDDDVAEMFPDAKSVNDALRALGKIIAKHQQKTS